MSIGSGTRLSLLLLLALLPRPRPLTLTPLLMVASVVVLSSAGAGGIAMSASGETSGALISAEPPLMDIMVELAFFFLSAVDEADAGAEVRAAGVGL